MLATGLARLDKVGLASHRCNENFGEGWTVLVVRIFGLIARLEIPIQAHFRDVEDFTYLIDRIAVIGI
jgi:hypothetical protein